MKRLKSFKFSIFFMSIIMVGLSACVYDPHYYGPGPRPYYPHYYPYYYDYYYYPSVRVYFHFSTGYYYYLSGRQWLRVKVLPPHIRLDPRERVTIREKSDKPYLNYQQHMQQYQPRSEYRPQPKVHKEEQLRNLRTYEQHQKKQKEYEKEWQQPGKKDKKR